MSTKGNFFWLSYSDLMTSLFFIMLVLFVMTVILLKRQVIASEDAINKINQVVTALQALDTNYYSYDVQSMRYRLNIDVVFRPNDDDIMVATDREQRKDLIDAGRNLYSLMENVVMSNPEINYLLVIEGNTQRVLNPEGWNYKVMPDVGYQLSYRRALSLISFWKENDIDFDSIKNCEPLICGSGYFGKSRTPMVDRFTDSNSNRKFTIQITPKIGKIRPD